MRSSPETARPPGLLVINGRLAMVFLEAEKKKGKELTWNENRTSTERAVRSAPVARRGVIAGKYG